MEKDTVISSEQRKSISIKPNQKRPWSPEEKQAVMNHLGKYILEKKLPGADVIRKCIAAEPILKCSHGRTSDFCRNTITTMSKNEN